MKVNRETIVTAMRLVHPRLTSETHGIKAVMELAGKVVVVTGASMGIGEAIAKIFADQGASVVMLSRDAGRVEAARARIGHTERTLAMACDVRHREDIDRAIGLDTASFSENRCLGEQRRARSAGFRGADGDGGLPGNVRDKFFRSHGCDAGGDSSDAAAGRRNDYQHIKRGGPYSAAVSCRLQRNQVCAERHRKSCAAWN